MFLTGSFGIMIGGPLALIIVSHFDPSLLEKDGVNSVWRGLTTIAGSWIGGGANQAAMKEMFDVGDYVFSSVLIVDVLVGYGWMAVLLYFVRHSDSIDYYLKADNTVVKALIKEVSANQDGLTKTPSMTDLLRLCMVGFGVTGVAHYGADFIAPSLAQLDPDVSIWLIKLNFTNEFFWLIVLTTAAGVALSFTPLRNYENFGAAKLGTVFLYILIVTMGMKLNLMAIFDAPVLFLVGFIWLSFHVALLLVIARLTKAPLFFISVGSMANIGGAASAPVVASAFHPSLAPVGVLLAVLGYAVGTFGAWGCAIMLDWIAG